MKYLRILCFAVLGALVAACSGDDATDGGDSGKNVTHEPITVKINLSTEAMHSGRGGRAVPEWTDAANEAEMMHKWFVVITEGTTIKAIVGQKCSSPTEKDTYSKTVEGLSTKTEYTFYSFANMDLSDVGLSESSTTLPAGFDSKAFKASGNGFDPTDENTKGIPMSNKQTFPTSTFTENKEYEVDLWVVRMYAKVELKITNMTASTVKVKSITLSDLTANCSESVNKDGNIKLLPSTATDTNDDNDGDEQACKPNLADGAKASDCTFGYGTDQLSLFTSTESNGTTTFDKVTKETGDIEIDKGATQNIVFYVNESAKPTNNHGLFILSLETLSGDNATTATKRYALITNDAKETDGDWSYIARNDYRIIPINLYDYKLELEVFKDAPIGVYPAVELKNDLFTVNFYDAGHFHLIPIVRKLSTNAEVPYSSTVTDGNTTWSLPTGGYTAKPTWAPSLTSYDDYMDVTGQTEKGGWTIYEQDCSATADGSENGGQPKWIDNLDNTHCNSTTHSGSPGLLGKLGAATSTKNYDGTAYHELKVQVNDGSTAVPELTYRICVKYKETNK